MNVTVVYGLTQNQIDRRGRGYEPIYHRAWSGWDFRAICGAGQLWGHPVIKDGSSLPPIIICVRCCATLIGGGKEKAR